jgi:hypothetical protein
VCCWQLQGLQLADWAESGWMHCGGDTWAGGLDQAAATQVADLEGDVWQ